MRQGPKRGAQAVQARSAALPGLRRGRNLRRRRQQRADLSIRAERVVDLKGTGSGGAEGVSAEGAGGAVQQSLAPPQCLGNPSTSQYGRFQPLKVILHLQVWGWGGGVRGWGGVAGLMLRQPSGDAERHYSPLTTSSRWDGLLEVHSCQILRGFSPTLWKERLGLGRGAGKRKLCTTAS